MMNKHTLRQVAGFILLAGFIGATTTAYGAGKSKKLSEAEACELAKSEILTRQGGENKRELDVVRCDKFSILDLGVASIKVMYHTSYFNEYMKTRYETKNLIDACQFTQTSQGWKLIRCK